jgi:hypothetical protein
MSMIRQLAHALGAPVANGLILSIVIDPIETLTPDSPVRRGKCHL